MNPDDRRPLAYLGVTVLLWGTSFAVTKSAYASFPPMTVIWLRMVIAFLAALPFLRRLPRPDYRRGDWKYLTVATLFLPCLYFALEGYAIQFTSSGQAGVVAAVMPLIVGLAAWVFLRERPTWQRVAAILASMLGVAMLSLGGLQQAAAPNPGLGNLLELGAMVAAAGATITIKHLSTRYDAWLLTAYLEKLATGINTDLRGATGRLQLDGFGNVVPRSIVTRFECRLDGQLVFAADLYTAIAANLPFVNQRLMTVLPLRVSVVTSTSV